MTANTFAGRWYDTRPYQPGIRRWVRIAKEGGSIGGTTTAAPLTAPGFKPYVYRGTGRDELTAFMDDEPVTVERLSPRQERLEAFAVLRVWCDPGDPPPGFVTAQQAADRLGVSRRTVGRYKRNLAAAAAERTGGQA